MGRRRRSRSRRVSRSRMRSLRRGLNPQWTRRWHQRLGGAAEKADGLRVGPAAWYACHTFVQALRFERALTACLRSWMQHTHSTDDVQSQLLLVCGLNAAHTNFGVAIFSIAHYTFLSYGGTHSGQGAQVLP